MSTDDESLRTSWTQVARLKNLSDQEGWKDFYEVYSRLILGVAVKAGLRQEEAEDVLQETMSSVVRHIPDFVATSAKGSFRAWLLNMARWRITDQLRRRLPLALDGGDSPDELSSTAVLDRVPDREERKWETLCDKEWEEQIKEQAVEKLRMEVKAEHYQIFYLLVLEEKPPLVVAKLVGCSRAQVYLVKHRVSNMLKRIARQLEKSLK